MDTITWFVKRRPLITFFVLAFAITWTLVPLVSISFAFPVLGLFGPALAAIIVTAIAEGGAGVRALLSRVVQWRVGWVWYVAALGLPFALTLAARGFQLVLGGSTNAGPGDPIALIATLALLVVGEELGWRGFALPRSQARYGNIGASAILGCSGRPGACQTSSSPGSITTATAFRPLRSTSCR